MPKILGDTPRLMSWFQEIIDSGHFTEGKFVKHLEQEIGDFYGMHAIAVNSAGSGLFAVLRSLDLRHDRPIAVPNNTFYATAGMAREITREITLIDADRADFSMSYDELHYNDDRLHEFQAVMLTHVGGGMSRNTTKIAGYCRDKGIPLIEDAAHALGLKPTMGAYPGLHGTAAVFSLYPTKALPAGEGGIVITKDRALAERVRRFRNYGKFKGAGGGVAYDPRGGFNLRLDEWTAAVALHQWRRRDKIIEARATAAEKLARIVPPMVNWEGRPTNWYKFIVTADFQSVRKTGQVYASTDQMASVMGVRQTFPHSTWIAENHICLPIEEGLYDNMSSDQIEAWLMGNDDANPNWRRV